MERENQNLLSILVSRVFTNGPGDLGSIPGRVIPKTQKMILDTSLLNTQHYKVRIKGKWSNPETGLVLFPTPRSCSYWKRSLRVALDNGWQLNLLWYIYMFNVYIKIYTLKNSYSYENDDVSGVKCSTDMKSPGFRSQPEASRQASHTEVMRYNKTVCWPTGVEVDPKHSFQ